jgi:phage terminase small subunit
MAYYFHRTSGELLVAEELVQDDTAHAGTRRKHPAFQTWRDSTAMLQRLLTEYGMTPSSRTRLQLPAGPDPENPWSGF